MLRMHTEPRHGWGGGLRPLYGGGRPTLFFVQGGLQLLQLLVHGALLLRGRQGASLFRNGPKRGVVRGGGLSVASNDPFWAKLFIPGKSRWYTTDTWCIIDILQRLKAVRIRRGHQKILNLTPKIKHPNTSENQGKPSPVHIALCSAVPKNALCNSAKGPMNGTILKKINSEKNKS